MKHYCTFLIVFLCCSAFGQQEIVYNTNFLPKADTTWVFTPADAKSTEGLPLVFLLNGYGGNHKQWNNIMNAQKYADQYGFILVCPDGLINSWYLNSPSKPDMQYASFFFKTLFPDIMARLKPDKSNIFITGLSMGGHGALTLFLQHPELFKSAGSTSGVTDLSGVKSKYELSMLLGSPAEESNTWKNFSVAGNINKLQGTGKAIIFDCGADDPFYKMNNELKAMCDALKIKATYISQPGNHNRAYWAKTIKQHLDFFTTQLH